MTKSDPLVSIIVPAYNYEDYLRFTINSALNQTYSNCEVVVVNDGSTDGTHDVAETYAGQINYVRQENQGLSAARNSGIRKANGEFLVFLDADDILKPEMVEQSLQTLEKLGSNFAVVAHLPEFIDQHGGGIDRSWGAAACDTEVTYLDLMIQNRFPPTLLVRKNVFEEVGDFDRNLKASEDRDMWIRIARKFRIFRLDKSLSYSRRHSSNMSADGVRQSNAIRQVHRKAWQQKYLKGWRTVYWLKIASFFLFQRAMMTGQLIPISAFSDLIFSFLLWPVFLDREELGHPFLFRIRLAARIVLDWVFRGKAFLRRNPENHE